MELLGMYIYWSILDANEVKKFFNNIYYFI